MKFLTPLAMAASLALMSVSPAYTQTEAAQQGGSDISKTLTPAKAKPRFFMRYEIRQRKDDAYISFVEPLYDLPLTDKVVLRTQVPYVVNNPADAPSTDGLGDITNVLSYRYFSGAGRSYDVGLEVRWNTASAPELGVGNTLLAPTWFGSITVPKYNTILFPLVQTFISVDRDEGRRKLHYTVLKGRFLTKLENRYYIYVEPVIYVQHRRDNETTGTLELEFGRFVNAQTMLYLRPGAGLWGNVGSPYLFEWNFEVGYRYFFK